MSPPLPLTYILWTVISHSPKNTSKVPFEYTSDTTASDQRGCKRATHRRKNENPLHETLEDQKVLQCAIKQLCSNMYRLYNHIACRDRRTRLKDKAKEWEVVVIFHREPTRPHVEYSDQGTTEGKPTIITP